MAQNKSQYAIETFSLTKIFPDWWGRPKVVAVDQLDLKIKHSEVYGLLGPNGSGKTTTLKMLLGLLHPTKGKTLMLGQGIDDPKVKDRIGYLPEESYLYKFLNARETLDFYGRIFGLPRGVRKSRIDALLEMVGLAGMANRPVGTYSKGMARRIGLAQALINDPDLLILDEPTSGMDPIGTRQMKDLILQLARRGKTILLCSHLLADVEDVCDRIGILYGGRMQVEGEVSSLLQHTDQTQITAGQVPQSTLERIKDILEAEGASCEVSRPMDKLEEYFIRAVKSAQEKRMPTSGAISTTDIGGFLSEQMPGADLLDQLVSASVTPRHEHKDAGDVQTEKVNTASNMETEKPDASLLQDLTQPKEREKAPTQNAEPAKVEPVDVDKETKPDQSILDALTDRGQKGDASTQPPEVTDKEEGRNDA